MLLFFPKSRVKTRRAGQRVRLDVRPQRTRLVRTIFFVDIWKQSHLLHYHGSAALFLSWQRSWLASVRASHLGTYLMNLPRVKYFPSSWDRKAVSPRSGFSAISCVTRNCAQQMFTRYKSRCIKSQLRWTEAPSLETRLLSESGNYPLRSVTIFHLMLNNEAALCPECWLQLETRSWPGEEVFLRQIETRYHWYHW